MSTATNELPIVATSAVTLPGLKAVLLDRLKNELEQRLPVLSNASQAARFTDDLTGFSANARWKLLEPIETAAEEPQNVVPMTAPTIPINEAALFHRSTTSHKYLTVLLSWGWKKFQNVIVMVGQLFMMVNLYLKRRLMSWEDQKLIFC